MKNKVCYLFVFNGYSDWEPALAAASLQQFSEYEVRPFSIDGNAVVSAANLRVIPQLSLEELDAGLADIVILPGGAAWGEGKNREIGPFILDILGKGKLLAAICDATLYLASEGLLDDIPHTSNDLGLLKAAVPGYKGEKNYMQKPAVTAGQVITANGTAGTAFAHAIVSKLELLKNEQFAFWFGFFHKPEFQNLWHE
ncbi:DJ-1/PfpI family protein [Chitinophaga sp. GCM10012297]|uniref:DJ-1/PfpI family protein n=1 Tax=Chitinophaga chungangae TaxID=2821488 RepID=A0ABS3YE04_9BACT|nr:DJ-1/PfpI family protein [Chitinophaga chungangae]MBO9152909.1 DJ-1/PfpI family protein [Chitinophaga chungangae]